MTSVDFYHLTRTGAEAALPRLLGRTLAAGQRAVVLLREAARVEAISRALWASQDPPWLPHGTPAAGEADLQPIWLTTEDASELGPPNGARYLFLLDGAESARLALFERVFDLFDGRDEAAVQAARSRWAAAKAAGFALAYWQQRERGWERKT
jgi:DNA polymerase III subunit chi